MFDTGSLNATRSACQQIIDGVPLGQLKVARTRARTALDFAQMRLIAAVDHARRLQVRL